MKNFSKELEKILRQEIAEHNQLLALLLKERDAMKAFKSEDVEKLAEQREISSEKTRNLRDKRIALIDKAGLNSQVRLSELVTQKLNAYDQKILLPIINQLKKLVEQVRQETRAHNQVVKFSLDLVNGSLSILSSASREVTKIYGQSGEMQEKSHSSVPGHSLREA